MARFASINTFALATNTCSAILKKENSKMPPHFLKFPIGGFFKIIACIFQKTGI